METHVELPKPTLNVELLLKVKNHILEEPKRLRMSKWFIKGTPNGHGRSVSRGYGEPIDFEVPACGTVGCIAGWTELLNHPEDYEGATGISGVHCGRAKNELGLIDQSLFFVDCWPEPYKSDYYQAEDNQTRAQIVGALIDKLIEVGEEQLFGRE